MTSKFMTTASRRSRQSGRAYTPWKYQRRAIKFLLERVAAALFLDPGLGKTSIVLAAFLYLLKRDLCRGMIVFAPLRACQLTWPEELAKWSDFHGLDMVLLHGPEKEKKALEKHDIYVVNYEGIDWLLESKVLQKMLGRKLVDIVCWDELTKMKNSDSKRFKRIKPYLTRFSRRWGLTGSPASNGLLGLFGQCFVLDCGKAFGRFITMFRHEFFLPDGIFGWKPSEGGEKLIYERLKPLALRMDADELLDMPREIPHRIAYRLPEKVRAHYEELENDFLTVISGNKVSAVNSGVASGKLRQLCSGAMYTHDYNELTGAPKQSRNRSRDYVDIHEAKLDAFEDLVDELNGQQVFVAYEFQHDLSRIQRRFGEVPFIGGGTSAKTAQIYKDAWNSGELPWLFGHPQSVGHALNMQDSDAHNIIFYTVPWDYELYDQFIRRLRRQGNKSKVVNVYHLVAEDSVEEGVMMSLANKERTQKQLFTAIRNRRQLSVNYDPLANAIASREKERALSEQRRKVARRTKDE